jgi:hypothetical protein
VKQDYYDYIASDEWARKRKRVLERDNHECQTCLNGTDLEVHHKTYERLGHEHLSDLITLCRSCHEAITSVIRQRRYSKAQMPQQDTKRLTPNTERLYTNVSAIPEVQIVQRVTSANAQWQTSRSDE